MAMPENKPDVDNGVSFRWGTWEELLLAFAVNRHGTGGWASIASELQKRISGQNPYLTAQNCRQKYLDLKRRYVLQNNHDSGKHNDDEIVGSVPLLEELRKLRVEELRLEVQRYDLNIESLESKMKTMEEERDRNATTVKTNQSDLEIENEKTREEENTGPSPEKLAGGDLPSAGESEKDRISVNESNSTDLGADKCRTGEKESEPVDTKEKSEEPVDLKPEPVHEDSCNESSNSIKKKTTVERGSPESEAESKEGDDAIKEAWASDVQSSASRSRKEGNDKMRRGSTSGEERDNSVQSQPFIDFLQSIAVNKLGSKFHRRLKTQESSKYRKLVLQHVDLETIETRLKQGWYGDSSTKFYRDLLLLVNNALVFFSKNSPEAEAAIEIRQLISDEMSHNSTKSESSSRKQASLQSLSVPLKEEHDTSHSLLKPRISGPLIVCRKRSSIAAKGSVSSSRADNKKKDQVAEVNVEDSKALHSQLSDDAEEPKVTKKRTRDRIPSISANSKKIGKNQANDNGNKNPVSESGKQQSKTGSPSLQSGPKDEKKKAPPVIETKKRGAANFLHRMKQSSSSNGVLLDALKNTPLTSDKANSKGGTEIDDNPKLGEKKNQALRRGSTAKQAKKEKGSLTKRNVGRPPKKGAPPPPPPPTLGRRSREKIEAEIVASKPKKRSRKL